MTFQRKLFKFVSRSVSTTCWMIQTKKHLVFANLILNLNLTLQSTVQVKHQIIFDKHNLYLFLRYLISLLILLLLGLITIMK